jgi:hypothetical protein
MVRLLLHLARQRGVETGPTGAGIELRPGVEELLPTSSATVDAVPMMVVVATGEG